VKKLLLLIGFLWGFSGMKNSFDYEHFTFFRWQVGGLLFITIFFSSSSTSIRSRFLISLMVRTFYFGAVCLKMPIAIAFKALLLAFSSFLGNLLSFSFIFLLSR